MKLIIELSENDYMALKEDGVQNHLALADTVIANSVPYEEGLKGKWTPVSKELPNVSQRYLVYTKYDEVMTDFFMGEEFMQGDDIIAWMPLPEPYKEGEEQ